MCSLFILSCHLAAAYVILVACSCESRSDLAGDVRETMAPDSADSQLDDPPPSEPSQDPGTDDPDLAVEEAVSPLCGNGIVDEGEECEPGDVESQFCGRCGEAARACTDACTWSEHGECENETGDCEPQHLVDCVTSCGTPGTAVCTFTCEVPGGACCMPDPVTEEICSNGIDDDCDGNVDLKDLGPGQRISEEGLSEGSPSLAWTGSEYGITWTDSISAMSQVYFARLDADGVMLGEPVRLSDSILPSGWSSLLWNGTEFAAAWSSDVVWDSGMDVTLQLFFTRISPEGVELGEDIRVTRTESTAYFGSSASPMVWTGSEYGLAWFENGHITNEAYFGRLDPFGVKLGEDVRITDTLQNSSNVTMAWTGSEFGLAWAAHVTDESEKVLFARLDTNGVKVGDDVTIVESDAWGTDPILAWNGSEYVVLWSYTHRTTHRTLDTNVYFTRVSPTGERLGDHVLLNDCITPEWTLVVAWDGIEYVIVLGDSWRFSDAWEWNEELFILRVSDAGEKIGAPFRLTYDSNSSRDPDLALNGSSYAVAWMDDRLGDYRIFFTRVGCD